MAETQTISHAVTRIDLGGWFEAGRGARPVNVYLVDGRHPTLIGSGHRSTVKQLTDALRELGTDAAHIQRILAGSWHADTLGGASQFPGAELLVASIDFVQPRHWSDWLDARRATAAERADEIAKRVPDWDRGAIGEYLERRFPAVTNHLSFVPIRSGQSVAASELQLELVAGPGTQVEHVMFWEPEDKLLFCGDLTTGGLPSRVKDIQDYIVTIERAMQLEPEWLLPSQGAPSPRAMSTLRRMLSFCNNFLSNAPATLPGGRTILEFVDADLGHQPEHAAEYLEAVEDRLPFLEELFRSHMIEAEGDGFDRRYGTNVESPRTDLQI